MTGNSLQLFEGVPADFELDLFFIDSMLKLDDDLKAEGLDCISGDSTEIMLGGV